MKTSKPVLVAVGIICLALVGAALYLQHTKDMLPCPWCVIQRYVFIGIAILCFVFAALPRGMTKLGASLGVLAGLGGLGAAGWLLWVKAHPSVSCGIDPLETSLNKIPTAELLPYVFRADGLCTTEYDPVFGLQVAEWSALWFGIIVLVLAWASLRQDR